MAHGTDRTSRPANWGTRIFGGVLLTCVAGGVALAMVAPAPRKASPAVAPRQVAVSIPQQTVVAPKPAPVLAPAPVQPVEPAAYTVKSVLKIDKPLRQGDFYWDESQAPATGPMVVTVDLAAQTVSVFRDGHEIGTAVIIYGSDETPTPLGIYPITQKDADHISNIYHTPMPYMLRLTNDGISIHGSEVGDGYVTHGCVGVPTAFAKKIFGVVKLGDRVIITRGERLDIGQAIKAIR